METNAVSQFTLEPEELRSIRIKYTAWFIDFLVGLGIVAYLDDPVDYKNNSWVQTSIAVSISVVVILFVLALVALRIGHQVERVYAGLVIRFDDHVIERVNKEKKQTVVFFADVRQFTIALNGDLFLLTDNKNLSIPHQIARRDELEALLIQRLPLYFTPPANFYNRYYSVLCFMVFFMMCADWLLHNKTVVSVNSGLLLTIMSYDWMVRLRMRKKVTSKIRDNALKTLLFMMLIVVGTLVYKFYSSLFLI